MSAVEHTLTQTPEHFFEWMPVHSLLFYLGFYHSSPSLPAPSEWFFFLCSTETNLYADGVIFLEPLHCAIGIYYFYFCLCNIFHFSIEMFFCVLSWFTLYCTSVCHFRSSFFNLSKWHKSSSGGTKCWIKKHIWAHKPWKILKNPREQVTKKERERERSLTVQATRQVKQTHIIGY